MVRFALAQAPGDQIPLPPPFFAAHGAPTSDLAVVIHGTPPEEEAAVPLKPSVRVLLYDPAGLLPGVQPKGVLAAQGSSRADTVPIRCRPVLVRGNLRRNVQALVPGKGPPLGISTGCQRAEEVPMVQHKAGVRAWRQGGLPLFRKLFPGPRVHLARHGALDSAKVAAAEGAELAAQGIRSARTRAGAARTRIAPLTCMTSEGVRFGRKSARSRNTSVPSAWRSGAGRGGRSDTSRGIRH